jgi:pimeloyl-ACP methyl ester carboxylesterase
MRIFKKILKIAGLILLILFIGLYIAFYRMTDPKPDAEVMESFQEMGVTPSITWEKFRTFDFRKVAIQQDSTLPTFVFVHGTIGSVLDFKKYMTDSLLLTKANMIVYDRIGYNYEDEHSTQESIAFEADMLEYIIKDLNPEKTILVGYSYGGPIVLASKKKYKEVLLFAPAVYSEVEPMPGFIKIYEWKLTRWLVPPIWKEAAKEKLTHRQDLKNFEDSWDENPNPITSVHGESDMIVPYANSEYLQQIFPEEQFTLVAIPDAGHGLVWTEFSALREALLNTLD